MAQPIDLSNLTTLEDQFLAVAAELQLKELAVEEDLRPNNITVAPDAENQNVDVTASIPVVFSREGSSLKSTAFPYLA